MVDSGRSSSIGPFSNDPPGDGAPLFPSPEARLQEQAVKAFGILQRRADREIAPERLRAFLQSQSVTPETLFDCLVAFARAKGLVVVRRQVRPDALLDAGLVDDLILLPSTDIGLVTDVRPRERQIVVRNLDSGRTEPHSVDDLQAACTDGFCEKGLPVLHLQGQAPRYLDDGSHAPPLYSDRATDVDPHDRLDNVKETFEGLLRLLSVEWDYILTMGL